jgi:hypothetical protein
MEEQSAGHLWRNRAETLSSSLTVGGVFTADSFAIIRGKLTTYNGIDCTKRLNMDGDNVDDRTIAFASAGGGATVSKIQSFDDGGVTIETNIGSNTRYFRFNKDGTILLPNVLTNTSDWNVVNYFQLKQKADWVDVVFQIQEHNSNDNAHDITKIKGATNALNLKANLNAPQFTGGVEVSGNLAVTGAAQATGDVTGFLGSS